MKRLVCFLLTAVFLLAGCAEREDVNSTPQGTGGIIPFQPGEEVRVAQDPVFDYAGFDWSALLLKDAFTSGTPMGDAALSAIAIDVVAVTADTLTLQLSAPQIGDALWTWHQSEAFSESAWEEKVTELLKSAPQEKSFTLTYWVRADGLPVINYTAEYVSWVSCGLTDVYRMLQEEMLAEMEASYE